MPVNEGNEGALTVAAPPSGGPGPGPGPAPGAGVTPSYTPNVLDFGFGAGLHGRARFEAQRNEVQFAASADDYKNWLLSLKDDPNDLEYTLALREAREKLTASQPKPAPSAPVGPAAFPAGPGERTIKASKMTPEEMRGSEVDQEIPQEPAPPTEEDMIKFQKDWRKAVDKYKTPVFRGRPIDGSELYEPGPMDGFLDDWLQENGIQLDANNRSKALKSGAYVYMGTEINEELGGVPRDVYVYKDQAEAASQSLDPAVISNYQKELGLTVTGRMDPYLQPIWEEAVKFAQNSARDGQKISVREWFDLFVQSAIAKKRSSGGGGGGGADPEEFDYYRGMMQILGDISGVGGG